MKEKYNDSEPACEHTASDFLWAMQMMKKYPWSESSFTWSEQAQAHAKMAEKDDAANDKEKKSRSRSSRDEAPPLAPPADAHTVIDILTEMQVRKTRADEINSAQNYGMWAVRPLQGDYTLRTYGDICDAWQGYAKEDAAKEFAKKYGLQESMRFSNTDCGEERAISICTSSPVICSMHYVS